VSYVTDGKLPPPPHACQVETVASFDDETEVYAAVRRIIALTGAVERLVALDERDALLAARVRDRFVIPGPTAVETLTWCDRIEARSRLATAGIPVPASADAADTRAALDLAERHGYPLLARAGQRVGVIACKSALERALFEARSLASMQMDDFDLVGPRLQPSPRLVIEECLRGAVLCCHGVVAGGRIVAFHLWRLAAQPQGATAAVLVDDAALHARTRETTERTLSALRLRNGPFRIELSDGGDLGLVVRDVVVALANPEARRVVRDTTGIELEPLACAAVCGGALPLRPRGEAGSGGYLTLPGSTPPLVGVVPQVYAESRTSQATTYFFRGRTAADVEAAMGHPHAQDA
jgi:hypothetical protein